jgi:hypothetical protein
MVAGDQAADWIVAMCATLPLNLIQTTGPVEIASNSHVGVNAD